MAQYAKKQASDIVDVYGQAAYDVYKVQDAAAQAFSADYTESGDKEEALGTFGTGTVVLDAFIKISGAAFQGKVGDLRGVKVTQSPMIYGADGKAIEPSGNEQAFIIDFTTICSILKIEILDSKGMITLVLPWIGTEFTSKSVYPAPQPASAGQFIPKPDTVGKESAGMTGVDTMKLFVQIKPSGKKLTETDFSENCRIVTATFPSNIKASLNDRPPFWTNPGVLNNTAEVTGLGDELNVLLKDIGEPAPVKLFLTTDTPGVLLVEEKKLDAGMSAHAVWGNQATIDIPLKAMEPTQVSFPFPATTDGTWRINSLTVDLEGQFPDWQAFPDQGSDTPGKLGLKVNARFSLARRFLLEGEGELHGFSLLIMPPENKAEIRIEVVSEKDGQPDQGKSLAAIDVSIPADTSLTPRWQDCLFPSPVKITPNEGMWLVAKAKAGSIEFVGIQAPPATPPATLLSDEGSLWRQYPMVNGNAPMPQIRVLRKPFINENIPLLDVALSTHQETIRQSSGALKEPATLEFVIPEGHVYEAVSANGVMTIPLTVTARTSGLLKIKGATILYQ